MKRDKFLILILILYVASLFLPEVITADLNGNQYSLKGYFILFFGWFAMFDWSFVWLANPLFLFALLRFHNEEIGRVLFTDTLALCLGLAGFTMQTTTNIGTGNEDPVYLAIGYYVWIGVLAMFVLYSLLSFMGKVKNQIDSSRGAA